MSWADSFKSAPGDTMATPRQTIQLRQEHARMQRLRCPLLSLSRWGKLAVCQSAMALRGKRGASAAVQQVIPACSQALNKRRPLPERRVSSRAGCRATRQADLGAPQRSPHLCASAARITLQLGKPKDRAKKQKWGSIGLGHAYTEYIQNIASRPQSTSCLTHPSSQSRCNLLGDRGARTLDLRTKEKHGRQLGWIGVALTITYLSHQAGRPFEAGPDRTKDTH